MKQHAPSCARNRDPILSVLRGILPPRGLVLEVAAGSGEHARYFSDALPALAWQPTDPSEAARASIDAWREGAVGDLRPALRMDVHELPWPVTAADAVVCINMIHIAPWSACEALLRGTGAVLPPGGVLYLYGAYKRGGAHTAPSNESFDAWLKARDPSYGVRDLEAVTEAAAAQGFVLRSVIEMPANNLSVVFERR